MQKDISAHKKCISFYNSTFYVKIHCIVHGAIVLTTQTFPYTHIVSLRNRFQIVLVFTSYLGQVSHVGTRIL